MGRAPRVRGWMAGGVSCEKNHRIPAGQVAIAQQTALAVRQGFFMLGRDFRPSPPPSPEFPKILEKNPRKKSLQVARNCAIIQKLEYAGSRGRLHALTRRVTTGRAETSSLTKRGRQGRAGAWDALRSLYVDASNFKSPFGSREHITWRCNHTWHVLRA